MGAEDADGNLLPAVEAVLEAAGAEVAGLSFVEIGAGTGRVTRLLSSAGATVVATEPSPAMISIASDLQPAGQPATFCRAEASALPLRAASFDAAIAGWVFAHQVEWAPDSWREVVTVFVDELSRVVRPGGPLVLIETLGTGFTEPHPPSDLVEYYEWLEQALGFSRTWIRTDYEFESVEHAAEITGAFFGPVFAERVHAEHWRRVPECTGIWSRRT